MTDGVHSKFHVNLECSALGPDELVVVRMTGREEISRLFAFEIDVRPVEAALIFDDFQEIFDGTATLSFGPDHEHAIHGVIRQIDLLPCRDLSQVMYRMRLVPTLSDAKLTRGSWIYQELTPEQIVTKALTETLPEGARFTAGEHFEFDLQGGYTEREYVVQYEESVFDFVSRQLEHWGIFYYFDHTDETEKAVVSDVNGVFPQLIDFESIRFLPVQGTSLLEESIQEISACQQVVSKQVFLRDYNYRTPSLPLVTPPVGVDEVGIGDVHVSHDHFWTPAEGNMLATVRSQELFREKLYCTAKSCVRGLRAGHHFTLTGEVPEQLGLAREFLVVAVEHTFGAGADAAPYSNVLTLSPMESVYRPSRLTPKPRVHGFVPAIVDSEKGDDGINCPVDEWGRYKVVMPFDVAGETGGKATCWIRLMTPAAGGSWGMAQQIHVGQEVAVYHIDGDPDRPVLAGALPNFENPSVITSQNANVSQMTSRGGSGFRVRDA